MSVNRPSIFIKHLLSVRHFRQREGSGNQGLLDRLIEKIGKKKGRGSELKI